MVGWKILKEHSAILGSYRACWALIEQHSLFQPPKSRLLSSSFYGRIKNRHFTCYAMSNPDLCQQTNVTCAGRQLMPEFLPTRTRIGKSRQLSISCLVLLYCFRPSPISTRESPVYYWRHRKERQSGGSTRDMRIYYCEQMRTTYLILWCITRGHMSRMGLSSLCRQASMLHTVWLKDEPPRNERLHCCSMITRCESFLHLRRTGGKLIHSLVYSGSCKDYIQEEQRRSVRCRAS